MQGSLLGFVDRAGKRAAKDGGQPACRPSAPAQAPPQLARREQACRPSAPAQAPARRNAFVSLLQSQLRTVDDQPAEQPLPAAAPGRAAGPQHAAAPPPLLPAAAPSQAGWQPCPLCGESFPPHKLQRHVEEELAFLEDDDPNPAPAQGPSQGRAAPCQQNQQRRQPSQQPSQQQQRRAPPVQQPAGAARQRQRRRQPAQVLVLGGAPRQTAPTDPALLRLLPQPRRPAAPPQIFNHYGSSRDPAAVRPVAAAASAAAAAVRSRCKQQCL